MITIQFTDRRTGETKQLQHSESWDYENGAFQWGENSLSDDGRRADMMYNGDPKMGLGCTWNSENLITVVITDDHDTVVYSDPEFPAISRYEALRRSAGSLVDMSVNVCLNADHAEIMLPPARWVVEQLAKMPESDGEDLLEILEELIAALEKQTGSELSPALDKALQDLNDRMHQ
ncbi:MAG: hypothetical protein K2W95_28735 [Candidatus Obscuribacterales bacterium]|nr:hypothetical protein [Candidatus Obscuribacterales bacterium]